MNNLRVVELASIQTCIKLCIVGVIEREPQPEGVGPHGIYSHHAETLMVDRLID